MVVKGLPPNLKLARDEVELLRDQIQSLAGVEVLVGFPEESTDREPSPEEPAGMTNAALAYVHDNGAPERNIPARPFMLPAMQEIEPEVTAALEQIARRVVVSRGRRVMIMKLMERVGMMAELAIKKKINEGIPPPLSERTLRDRIRRGREGAMWELAWRMAGAPAGTDIAKPLIDTAQMRNAVKYVIRQRNKRRP